MIVSERNGIINVKSLEQWVPTLVSVSHCYHSHFSYENHRAGSRQLTREPAWIVYLLSRTVLFSPYILTTEVLKTHINSLVYQQRN